jgi:hypothetical protein
LSFRGYCPKRWKAVYSADLVDTNIDTPWSLCVGQPGAGNQDKAVYRGKKRVAYTSLTGGKSYGGISEYGYPVGIAGEGHGGGFGIIWESRGTLYVSRDGGQHWHPRPRISRPEVDFGLWASTLGNAGYVLLERNQHTRLLKTTDAGRTWRVVHRWR